MITLFGDTTLFDALGFIYAVALIAWGAWFTAETLWP